MTAKPRLIVAGCTGLLTDDIIASLEARGFNCEFLDLARLTSGVGHASAGADAAAPHSLEGVDQIVETAFLAGKVDGLVNILAPPSRLALTQKSFLSQTSLEWRGVLDINIYGVLDVTRAVLARMCLQKSGSLVSVTSNAGLRGVAGLNAYSATHAGIQLFTQCMAQDCGDHGVRINCIIANEQEVPPCDAAGAYKAPPLGPGNYGADVAAAAAFLLSEDASHITGSCMDVSGGWSLS